MKRVVWLALLLLLPAPLFAQSSLTLFLTSHQNGGSSSSPSAGLDLTISFDDGSGFGAAYARAFGGRFSGELAVFSTTSCARVTEPGGDSLVVGDIDLPPITAMLRIHLRRDGPFDVDAGAGAASVMAGDVEITDDPVRVIVDDVRTLAIGAGASWNFTPRLGLVLDARYLPLTLNPSAEGQDIDADMDPMLLSGGVRILF